MTVQVEDVLVVFLHRVGVLVLCDGELDETGGVVHTLPLLTNVLSTLPDGFRGVTGFLAGTARGEAEHLSVPIGELTETIRGADHRTERTGRLAQPSVSSGQRQQGQKSGKAVHCVCMCVLYMCIMSM